ANQRPFEPLRVAARRAVDDPADQRLRQQMLRDNERVRHRQCADAACDGSSSGGRRRYAARIFKKSDATVTGTCGPLDTAIHSARGPITEIAPECTTLYCSP